ncbi:MAG: RnfABCDGE type electron transport complex subunit B [Clostridium sp.]
MEITNILYPVLVFASLGLLLGLILGYANNKFKVEVDDRIPQVREALPGANCGGCGFAGCDAYAEAVVQGLAKANLCTPGGEGCSTKIGNIMGFTVEAGEANVAYVKCKGTCGIAKVKYQYDGIADCNQAMVVPGSGDKLCSDGCLGLGSCIKVCHFDALEIKDGVAVVNKENCVACGACVDICPKGLIEIVPKKALVLIQCNSKSKGKEVMDSCDVGCIACTLCLKACPKDAIEMNNNLPVIDYKKCVNCGICANKCPKNCIENKRVIVKKTIETKK